jgi:2'-5' RNA ligase
VIPVPEADGPLTRVGGTEYAHITLVYPFVDVDGVTPEILSTLRDRFAAFPAFGYRLERTMRFLDVVFLDPEPADPFRDLLRALRADEPDGRGPPYPLEVTDILPHLTVMRSEDPALMERVEAELGPELPIPCRATEAHLVTEGSSGEVHTRFALAGA